MVPGGSDATSFAQRRSKRLNLHRSWQNQLGGTLCALSAWEDFGGSLFALFSYDPELLTVWEGGHDATRNIRM